VSCFFCLSFYGQSAKLHIKAGEQFMANGMYDAALEEFANALSLDPNDGKTYFDIASVKLLKTDSLAAAQNFQKSAVMGYYPDANYFSAANLYYFLRLDKNALENINAGLSLKPKNFDLLLLKTKILFSQQRFAEAEVIANEAVKAKDMAIAYYYLGAVQHKLGKLNEAEKNLDQATNDKNFADAFIELARVEIELKEFDYAVDNCTNVLLLINPDNVDALVTRSEAFHSIHEPQPAIDDITKAISLNKSNWRLYLLRGEYNLDFALYSSAADDYTLALGMNDTLIVAYRNRALALEKLGKKFEARKDYIYLKSNYKKGNPDFPELSFLDSKIFELGYEANQPVISFTRPDVTEKMELKVKNTDSLVVLKGIITDESAIKEAKFNNLALPVTKISDGKYEFEKTVKSSDLDFVSITATDAHDNIAAVTYPVVHIETEAPVIRLISPAPEGSNIIHLETGDNTLYIEGKVDDASTINSIKVDELNASFAPDDYNPRFTATIDIKNRSNITLTAIDKFGNKTVQTYEFARDGYMLSNNNPMGKTWVVIIENTDYDEYGSLPGTTKDITALKDALSRYKISKVLHMKNMSKREMERFFAIDLRDLITSNNVNSLMIWYAGHGRFVKNTGYWVPVDGKLNDEYSYYNLNALKASLYSYVSLTHTLVVSDACAAGESFSLAMRGDNTQASCDNAQLVAQKSALVLTSSDSEPAMDNSFFAQTFSNTLANNNTDCISIDAIAEKISLVMQKNTPQKPVFGRISGMENNNGTFFFITR
jgi:tetratricopeptide (TPR) repeat protein